MEEEEEGQQLPFGPLIYTGPPASCFPLKAHTHEHNLTPGKYMGVWLEQMSSQWRHDHVQRNHFLASSGARLPQELSVFKSSSGQYSSLMLRLTRAFSIVVWQLLVSSLNRGIDQYLSVTYEIGQLLVILAKLKTAVTPALFFFFYAYIFLAFYVVPRSSFKPYWFQVTAKFIPIYD